MESGSEALSLSKLSLNFVEDPTSGVQAEESKEGEVERTGAESGRGQDCRHAHRETPGPKNATDQFGLPSNNKSPGGPTQKEKDKIVYVVKP